jgi:hypothetical protein
VLVVFIASDALMLTQEPCQWLWSWILLETMMGLYAHKVCAVVDTRCCCAIVSIWATPYLQMLESNMPRDARASSLPHAMLKKVALAGPKSLHIITRVASSLAGQLRMMAGPILCSKWRRARNKCNSRFLGSVVSQWHEIIEVFTAVCCGCQLSFLAFQIVLKSAQQSLVKILNEWVNDGKHDWLHEVKRVIVSERVHLAGPCSAPHF